MARATGKYALAISDRSGQAFPYREMLKEWNGSFVHISEFERKHPQLETRHHKADGVALMNARPQNFTVASGGGGSALADLSLPGDFTFESNGMRPRDPQLQEAKRQIGAKAGAVTIVIS